MFKNHKDNIHKRLYTRAAKFYNAVLISFLVVSSCSFALRNISTKISILPNPLLTSLNGNNSFFTAIMFFDDYFVLLLWRHYLSPLLVFLERIIGQDMHSLCSTKSSLLTT